jgi:hypothetical protein
MLKKFWKTLIKIILKFALSQKKKLKKYDDFFLTYSIFL